MGMVSLRREVEGRAVIVEGATKEVRRRVRVLKRTRAKVSRM